MTTGTCPACGRPKAQTMHDMPPSFCLKHVEGLSIDQTEDARRDCTRAAVADMVAHVSAEFVGCAMAYVDPPKTFADLVEAIRTSTEKAAEAMHSHATAVALAMMSRYPDAPVVTVSMSRHIENGGECVTIKLRLREGGKQ